jgi:chaperonin cofactor prefoldin
LNIEERLKGLEDKYESLNAYLQAIEHMMVRQGEMIDDMQKILMDTINKDNPSVSLRVGC